MAFWCYILRCSDGRYYTGHTDHLERRIAQHNAGGYCDLPPRAACRSRWPGRRSSRSRIEALEAERVVGGWSRAKKEGLIRGDCWRLLPRRRPAAAAASTSLDTNGDGKPSIEPHCPAAARPAKDLL
ncbi:GIY-YIG nuclease family protein [Sphingomonas sp. MMS24-JH45]